MVDRFAGGLLLAGCFLFAGTASGQSLLPLPASHASMEGSAGTNVPFGRSIPTRVQYVYDASLFSGPVTITAIRFRLDGGGTANAKTVDCEMWMSTMPSSLLGLSVDFAQNRGVDHTRVLAPMLLTLPGQTAAATPNPFLPEIALDSSFAYDPQNGPLVLEIVVNGQPPGSYLLDAAYVCDSPAMPIGPSACLGSTGLPLSVESATTQVIWGRPWVARALDALPGNLVLLVLGTIESGSWAGLSLPQDLAPLGAAGCFLSIDIAASYAGIAMVDGSATFPFAIPNNPQLLGEWIRFQAGAFDAAANALGLVTSQAQKVQVCGWEPVGRVWSNGTTAAFGTREIGLAAVVQLVVQ